MRKQLAMLGLVLAVMAGCTTDGMNEAMGIGTVTSSKSTFDGATIVNMAPALLSSGEGNRSGNIHLGARWSSALPDSAALMLSYESWGGLTGKTFANISSASVNIGGNIRSFNVTGLTQHDPGSPGGMIADTSSTNSVIIPLSLLRQMTTAPDVRLRIMTDTGYQDSIFSKERLVGGSETAIVPLRKFLQQVDAAIAAKAAGKP